MEIKTCPFCGNLAELVLDIDADGERWWRVECTHCGAAGGGFSEELDIPGNMQWKNITETTSKAVNAWNRRK